MVLGRSIWRRAPAGFRYNDEVDASHPDIDASTEARPPEAPLDDAVLHPNGRVTPADAPEQTGLKHFLFTHKGGVTLTFSALVYVVAWAMLRFTTWHNSGELIANISEAAMIGGLCDYIALRMIFERKWYLPGSGVLPRNREKLINGIANTIEKEWLTPQMIGDRLNRMNLVGKLGTALAEVDLAEFLAQPAIDRLLNRAAMYFEAPEVVDRLETFLRKALPNSYRRVYAALNRFGVKSISSQVASNLRSRLPQLRNDPELMTTLEGAVHEIGQQLHDPDSPAHELASRVIDTFVARAVATSRGQITEMVKENLMKLDDEKIRFQIESKTRQHLDWIRVNGGIFGAIFGLMFALSRLVAHHGVEILQRLHLGF
jgi:uncharacterized membrane-anchored protein YjiN (DUF445 family)